MRSPNLFAWLVVVALSVVPSAPAAATDDAISIPGDEAEARAASPVPEDVSDSPEAVSPSAPEPDDEIDFSTLKKATDFAPSYLVVYGKQHEEYVHETGLLAGSVHVATEVDEGDLYQRKISHYAGRTTPAAAIVGRGRDPGSSRRRTRPAASQSGGGMLFQVMFFAVATVLAVAAVIATRRLSTDPKASPKRSGAPKRKRADYVRLHRAGRNEKPRIHGA